jgi:tripartite-type tricarboxylate transporter receptor subunit TctC
MKMKFSCLALALVLTGVFAASAFSAQIADLPKAEPPILVTSLGQAPDGNTIVVLAKRQGVTLTYETLAPAERIKDFKTVIISFGVSLKGFGAAGVNLDTELARAAAIKDAAKANNVKLIGIHIGGVGRRDQMSNKLIENYAGMCDVLIVYKDGNQDQIFSKIAQDNKVLFLELEKLGEINEVLKQLLK